MVYMPNQTRTQFGFAVNRGWGHAVPVDAPSGMLLEVLQHVQKFDGPRDLDSVEYMAGEAQISHAVARMGAQQHRV